MRTNKSSPWDITALLQIVVWYDERRDVHNRMWVSLTCSFLSFHISFYCFYKVTLNTVTIAVLCCFILHPQPTDLRFDTFQRYFPHCVPFRFTGFHSLFYSFFPGCFVSLEETCKQLSDFFYFIRGPSVSLSYLPSLLRFSCTY